jgi:hypothetical protein
MRKILASLSLAALLVLSLGTAEATAPNGPGWYVVSVCGSASPTDCPTGPAPWYIGPVTTQAICLSQWQNLHYGPLGTWPRALSNCFYLS